VADEYLVRWLDDSSVAQDLGITAAPDGDYRLAVRPFGAVDIIEDDALAVAVGTEAVVYTDVMAANTYFVGLSGHGETDGIWVFKVNGLVKARGETRAGVPVWRESFFARHLYVPAGLTVELTVKNTGIITANYKALIAKEI
jgi:hypothetical protein